MELDFIADRPFMFAITGPENVLLFTGVVETPQ
jgi:serine protease inhibitor